MIFQKPTHGAGMAIVTVISIERLARLLHALWVLDIVTGSEKMWRIYRLVRRVAILLIHLYTHLCPPILTSFQIARYRHLSPPQSRLHPL